MPGRDTPEVPALVPYRFVYPVEEPLDDVLLTYSMLTVWLSTCLLPQCSSHCLAWGSIVEIATN